MNSGDASTGKAIITPYYIKLLINPNGVCKAPVNPVEPSDTFPIPGNAPDSANPSLPKENPKDAPSPG